MANVTMRQLRYFDALARHGHFGRAAEASSISQPALSMQIKELEDALGGLLLERSARQVAHTTSALRVPEMIGVTRCRKKEGKAMTVPRFLGRCRSCRSPGTAGRSLHRPTRR